MLDWATGLERLCYDDCIEMSQELLERAVKLCDSKEKKEKIEFLIQLINMLEQKQQTD